ncbi:MAG: glycyl-radical enzyme activating protein [Actinomycetes bacterium]|jgi:pyruvate formate lyase activating enzyme|nr:glycyl-radical enzyme activating protein [Actinomycetes bacterium]
MSYTKEMQETVGQVFNIQRFSTHDGPGIRTTVFLKGCPLRCFWCQNPESQSLEPVILVNREKCNGCGGCIMFCPNKANSVVDGQLVFDRSKCNVCGECISICRGQARRIEGAPWTVEDVLAEVDKDAPMYFNSGGGMTISGGDCEMQPEFTIALLKGAQERGYHTALEITGVYTWDRVKPIVEEADYILYDLKQMDDEKHKAGTGVSNKNILENAKNIVALGDKFVLFRMPLIPGYNDSKEDVQAVVDFVRSLGLDPEKHLELLAYNTLGEGKYDHMDWEGERPKYARQSQDYIDELNAMLVA